MICATHRIHPNVYISFLQNVETSPAPLNTPLLLASEYLSQVAVALTTQGFVNLSVVSQFLARNREHELINTRK